MTRTEVTTMLNVLSPGRAEGTPGSAYHVLRAVAGPLTVGRCVTLVPNPSDGYRVGLTTPSGHSTCFGILGANKLDVNRPALRQTAIPTDSAPAGTFALVAAQTIADQEQAYCYTNGGVYETDQVDTSSGSPAAGGFLTFQRSGSLCGCFIVMAEGGVDQKVARTIAYDASSGILRLASLLP